MGGLGGAGGALMADEQDDADEEDDDELDAEKEHVTFWIRDGDMLLLGGDSSSSRLLLPDLSLTSVVRMRVRGLCGMHTFSYGLLQLDRSAGGVGAILASKVKMSLNSSSDKFKFRPPGPLGDCNLLSRGSEPLVLISDETDNTKMSEMRTRDVSTVNGSRHWQPDLTTGPLFFGRKRHKTTKKGGH